MSYTASLIRVFSFCLLLSSMLVAAPDDTAHYEQATAAYAGEQYDKALELYMAIEHKNHSIYFNMGNCAYNLGKKGLALLYWRRAERECGFWGKQELLKNIALLKAEQALMQKKGSTSRLESMVAVVKAYFYAYLFSLPLLMMQLLFLTLWLFLFVYLRYLYHRRKTVLIVILFALITFFGTLLAIRYGMEHRLYGVVITPTAQLYAGPAVTFPKLGALPQAQELIILREDNSFYKIKSGRVTGCVARECVGKINEHN